MYPAPTVTQLWPFGKIADSALAYAGSTVNGSAIRMKGRCTKMRMQVVVSSGSFSSNNIVATVQTSPDNTTFYATTMAITFTADGTKTLEITVPVMEYVRIAYSGAASGTVRTVFFANGNWDEDVAGGGAIYEPEEEAANGFLLCKTAQVVDAAAAKASAVGGTAVLLQNERAHFMFILLAVAARTTGTITPKLQYSLDAGKTWLDSGDALSAINANGTSVLVPANGLGMRFRLFYTPASSFDGTIGATIYTDGAYLQAA